MKVIRKRLWAQEMTGNTIRWDVACGCVQSWDGQEWRDNIQADPRFGIMYLSPPRTGTDIPCDAATNMVVKIQSMVDAIILATTLIEMANAVFAVIAVFTPGFSLLMAFIIAACEALITIGVGLISLAFDAEAYDTIKCILADNLDADGMITTATMQDVKDKICSDMDVTVCAVMDVLLSILGTVGLNNAGSSGDETGDCSECPTEWEYLFDYRIQSYDLTELAYNGVWVDGAGWRTGAQSWDGANYGYRLYKQYTFPQDVTLYKADIFITPTTNQTMWLECYSAGFAHGGIVWQTTGSDPSGHQETTSESAFNIMGGYPIRYMRIFSSGFNPQNTFAYVKVYGTGVNPFD